MKKCKHCNGSGVLHRIIDTGMLTYEPCYYCKKINKKPPSKPQVRKNMHPSLLVH